jgi:hypothetical protein
VAVWFDSRRCSHRLVADPGAEEAGGCRQVSNADRTKAPGSSPFFARTVVAVIECLGSCQRLCRRFIPENLCITPAAVGRRALAKLTSRSDRPSAPTWSASSWPGLPECSPPEHDTRPWGQARETGWGGMMRHSAMRRAHRGAKLQPCDRRRRHGQPRDRRDPRQPARPRRPGRADRECVGSPVTPYVHRRAQSVADEIQQMDVMKIARPPTRRKRPNRDRRGTNRFRAAALSPCRGGEIRT